MKRGPIGRALEIACWASGLVLLALYAGARADGELQRRQAITAFAQARTQAHAAATVEASVRRNTENARVERLWASSAPDQTHWSESRIRAYAARGNESAASRQLPAALLRIRSVGLEVPVFADTSERNLNRGAGLVAGTAAPDSKGNVAIAAHRDGYFRALKDVAVGDVIEIDTLTRQRQYRVVDISVVSPTDVRPLLPTKVPAVTLVTCYPFYFVGSAPQRYIVRAVALNSKASVTGESK